jgi:hypothetical protein
MYLLISYYSFFIITVLKWIIVIIFSFYNYNVTIGTIITKLRFNLLYDRNNEVKIYFYCIL